MVTEWSQSGTMPDVPTPRELEVLLARARTGSGKATAYELGITEATVKTHLATIRHRLGAIDTVQAFAICVERGLIVGPSPRRRKPKTGVAVGG